MRSRTAKRRVDSRRVRNNGRARKLLGLLAIIAISGVVAVLAAGPRLVENGLKHKSLSELQAATVNEPNSPRILYYLGRSYRAAGQPAEALTAFRTAVGLAPDDEATVTSYTDLAANVDDPASIKSILDNFLKQHPDSSAGHLALARVLQRIDDPMAAFREAQQAVKLDAGCDGGWRIIGDTEMRRRNYPGAESAFAKLIALKPAESSHRLGRGDALFNMGRIVEAAAEYREAVRLAPEKAEPRVYLGKALRAQAKTASDYDEARTTINDALSRQAESPKATFDAYLEIGKSYTAQARWKDALAWFQAASRLHADNEDVHFQLAKCYRLIGQARLADGELRLHRAVLDYHLEESRLTNILKVDPKDDQTLLSLARLYASHNNEDRAATMYQILLRRSPQLPDAREEFQRLARRPA